MLASRKRIEPVFIKIIKMLTAFPPALKLLNSPANHKFEELELQFAGLPASALDRR